MIRSLGSLSPRIDKSAFISETAYVIGDVEICEGASIWPGVVIRGDSGKVTIGKFTCIQDNSVVHGDSDVIIGERVVIGHSVMCHAKFVGRRVLIGNGSTVNDGVEIGEDSLVASSSMVVDKMIVPPMSLVAGLPARVKGRVSEKHTALIKTTCEIYIKKGRQYKEEGGLESSI